MDFRRENSKLSLKRGRNNDKSAETTLNTPVRCNSHSEDEDSPYFPCSTQELRDDVDVLWDYNSPRSKPKCIMERRSKKRLDLNQTQEIVEAPKHMSNNEEEQIKQDFSKLREELRILNAELAQPEHEESLVFSPREEDSIKQEYSFNPVHIDPPVFDLDDSFDDEINDDDQFLLLSQQIDEYIDKHAKVKKQEEVDQVTQLLSWKEYKTDTLNSNQNTHKVFPRSVSEHKINVPVVSPKVEWHRTQSFESYSTAQICQAKAQEIERKRLEARAKLEAKKRGAVLTKIPLSQGTWKETAFKCSFEEIEKKRLQALAKLESKRQQEFIEKKKQEALRRREESRKKNAALVKSSLSARM